MNTEKSHMFEKIYNANFGNNTFKKLIETRDKISNNKYIRVNISKIKVEKIEEFLKNNRVQYSKTFLPNALKIEKSFFNISSAIETLTGRIYIQDLASQVPINMIDFSKLKKLNKKIMILDMAASPGSKTTQLADLLNFHKIKYEIIALEPNKKRVTRLLNNIQKQEFENIKIFNYKGQEFKTEIKFDLIILDAPCSGNLIDEKDWLNKRDLTGINEKSQTQKELLSAAYNLLSNKGLLIYSTCSIEPQENELNVDWFLKNFKIKSIPTQFKFPFSIKPLNYFENRRLNSKNSIRFMPYISQTQGFFVCLFEK